MKLESSNSAVRVGSKNIGDSLERKIFDLFRSEIDNDRFWAKKKCCKLFRKKGYYSKDREKKIVFDVSIEVYQPGATDFSVLVLIECKNYNHPVPVDDTEEFFSKLQQVSGANIKGVIASTNSFQAGARTFSKSKGIGLLRYFDKSRFKWELRRSASASARSTSDEAAYNVEQGLSREDFVSRVFDLYGQSVTRTTNSLWDFFEDFALDGALTRPQLRTISNPRSRLASQVQFLEKDDMESRSAVLLSRIGYVSGEVSLRELCAYERARSNLKVLRCDPPSDTFNSFPLLGRVVFDPPEIHLYRQAVINHGRDRFTLAHELAHYLLRHGRYMRGEYCQESDLLREGERGVDVTDIARMEFQANYLASCLLMPRSNVIADFRRLIRSLGLSNRGFGALYVDDQPCNLESYDRVIGPLMKKYGVSRSAISIRLEDVGLLRDARNQTGPQSIQSILVRLATEDNP